MPLRREFLCSMAAGSLAMAVGEDRTWTSIEDLASDVRLKKVSPVELTRACLTRIEKLNDRLKAFITVTADAALKQAKVLEADVLAGKVRGPLHGIPVGLKDLFDTAGVRTTAGSKHWGSRVPSEDAAVVRKLDHAGAVLIGKTNMDEFAYNFTGETSAFGTARNPWDTQRSPGGSSGGSAVAVAAGMCYGALGSDTGGSIRLPAALCGITGFKPTYGLVDLAGAAPLAWSLDHAGPMTRSARDAALLLEAMTGKPIQYSAVITRGLRIGVPRELFFDGVEIQTGKNVEQAIAKIGKMTAGVRDIHLPPVELSKDLAGFLAPYVRVIGAEAYAFHERTVADNPDVYHAGTLRSIRSGASVTAAEYIRARREMERLRAISSSAIFRDVDVLLTPAAPGPAFRFGEGNLVFLRNAAPWNLFGLPAISVPCGFTAEGLPVGLQITAAAGRDDVVLALASAYQDATEWHKRRPALT